MFSAFLQLLMSTFPIDKPQHISQVLWAVALFGQHLPSNQQDKLLDAFISFQHHLKPKEVSETLWALATMGAEVRHNQMQQLLNALVRGLPLACNADLANGLWAAAKIGCIVPLGQLHQLLESLLVTLPKSKNPGDFSNVMWALGKVGHKLPKPQTEQLLGCFVQLLRKAKVREIADVVWAIATMSSATAGGGLNGGRSSSSSGGSSNQENVELVSKEQLQQLVDVFVKGVAAAKPGDIAAVVWGTAALGWAMPQQKLQQLQEGFIQQLSKATSHEVSNMVCGLTLQQQQGEEQQQGGTAGRQQQQQQQKQLELLVDRLINALPPGGSPQDVSSTISALSSTGVTTLPPKQLDLLLDAFVKLVTHATPRDIGDTLAGAAALGHELLERQLQVMTDAFAAVVHQADAQAVRNVLWACGHYMFAPKNLLRVLPKILEEGPLAGANSLDWRELGGIAWACGELGYEDSYRVVRSVLQRAVRLLEQPGAEESIKVDVSRYGVQQSQQLLQTAAAATTVPNAAATATVPTAAAAAAAAATVPPTAAAAVTMVTACVVVKDEASGAVQLKLKVQEAGADTGSGANDKGTTAATEPTEAAAAVEGEKSGKTKATPTVAGGGGGHDCSSSEVEAPAITCICWAAAVLDMQKHYEQVLVLVKALGKAWGQQQHLNEQTLTHLRLVHLWLLDSEVGDKKGLEGSLTEQQLEQVSSVSLSSSGSAGGDESKGCTKQQQQWKGSRRESHQKEQQQLQKEVFASLKQLPVDWKEPPRQHQQTADGAFSVSIAGRLANANKQVVVEAEGPGHYRRPDRAFTGEMLYRNRALAARGYQVVSVPYYEWKAMNDPLKRQQYLTEVLVHGKSRASAKRPAVAEPEGSSGGVDRQSRKKRS